MSEVDLARRTVDEAGYVRFLVVKRIRANHVDNESFVRMFKDEARITSELRHTNIAQVYDFGRVGDEYYLALEYVPGIDLRGVLTHLRTRRKRMPVRMALKVASDVLDALHYAHTRTDTMGRPMEVVHRDVNPRNVMLSVSGEVKLIDFGVARATDRLERTQTDHFKGKVAYMAPEQVHGTDDLDHRVDIFAMGLTLYEMLTGKSAFAGLDQTQILFRIMNGRLPKLEVPREWGAPGRSLCQLVDKALEFKASDRYPTARAMRDAAQLVAAEFGGMPTQGEVSSWLKELEPDLEGQIREKMHRLSGLLPAEGSTAPVELAPPPVSDASATLERLPTEERQSSSLTAPVFVAAGLGTATLVGIILVTGVIAVIAIVLGAWAMNSGGTTAADGETTTVEVEPAVEDEEPAVDPGPVKPLEIWPPPYDPYEGKGPPKTGRAGGGTQAGTQAATSTASSGDEAASTDDAGTESGTDAGGDSGGAAAGTTTASTAPGTTTTEDKPPAADKQPPQTTAPAAAMGRLQVTSATKGVPILIDGKPSGHTTGEQFPWPAGRHTITGDGLAPVTVEVRPGLVAFVILKPQ